LYSMRRWSSCVVDLLQQQPHYSVRVQVADTDGLLLIHLLCVLWHTYIRIASTTYYHYHCVPVLFWGSYVVLSAAESFTPGGEA